MIDYNIDVSGELKKIREELGMLGGKDAAFFDAAVASATNAAAKHARKMMAEQAQKTYALTNANFNKEMSIKKATKKNFTAVISSYGNAIELIRFKTNPAKIQQEPPEVVKAKVLKTSTLKPLEKNGIKAFMVKFKSGHVTIAERKRKNDRLPIKVLYSHGMPSILGKYGNVWQTVDEEVLQEFSVLVYKEIDKLLDKAAKKNAKGAEK